MNNKHDDFEPCTLDDVAEALGYVDGGSRDLWIRMGCAIKNEFGEAGFDIWDSWSATCDGYNAKQIRTDWKAIKSTGGKGTVTIASLFKEAINNGYKRREMDEADRKRLAAECAQRRIEREKEARIEAAFERTMAEVAAQAARAVLDSCKPIGKSEYLGRKCVKGYGVGFSKGSMVLLIDSTVPGYDLITDYEAQSESWRRHNLLTDEEKELRAIRAIKGGVVVVPMIDQSGIVQNIQLIYKTGAKQFLRWGKKSGCWHMLGVVTDTLIIAEGYATAASIHEATGIPVAVCFDSGNMPKVALSLRQLHPNALIMLAADDDHHLEALDPPQPNAGKVAAAKAAKLVGGVMFAPQFSALEAVA